MNLEFVTAYDIWLQQQKTKGELSHLRYNDKASYSKMKEVKCERKN
jgi:hypothetical protein